MAASKRPGRSPAPRRSTAPSPPSISGTRGSSSGQVGRALGQALNRATRTTPATGPQRAASGRARPQEVLGRKPAPLTPKQRQQAMRTLGSSAPRTNSRKSGR